MKMIVKKELSDFEAQLREKKVSIQASEESITWLAQKGFSPLFGAREVARLVQEKIKNFFVDEVLFGKLAGGGKAFIDVKNDEIKIDIKDT
jgi:ATP-dependent Clp protease ATP-binding subunit ClpA